MSQQISCLHRKISFNRYSHEKYLQNCGHCFPCQLRKRNHYLHQLFNELSKKYKHSYFLTLTFDDKHIIYVDSILHKNDSPKLSPYSYSLFFASREIDKLRFHFNYDYVNELLHNNSIDSIYDFRYDLSDYDFSRLFSLDDNAINSIHLDKLYGNLPITFNEENNYRFRTAYFPFKAAPLYLKRLRKSFDKYCQGRNVETEKLVYFCCQEYGPQTLRPHFHLLILTNSDYFPAFIRSTMQKHSRRKNIYIHSLWKFGFVDFQRISNEEKVSTYIAGYINSFQLLPSTHVTTNLFTTKHSHSKCLGFDSNLYNATLNFFAKNSPFFVSSSYDFSHLLEDKFIATILQRNICKSKSELLQKYPAIPFRLFPKFPFLFLSSAKYDYKLIKEALSMPLAFYDEQFYHSHGFEYFPIMTDYFNRYIEFMLANYSRFRSKTFKCKFFKRFIERSIGDIDFDSTIYNESLLLSLYKEYYICYFLQKYRSFAIRLHNSIKSIFPDYTSINRVRSYFNMSVFADELRSRFLLQNFYPKLIQYMGDNNYSFDDVSPLFYPTDFAENNHTRQLSNYIVSLIPDYTKHRAHKEPIY